MIKKEYTTKDGNKYIVEITETKNCIKCSILKKSFMGYKELFSQERWKPMSPDYNYITLCTVGDYEQELKDKERLIKWSITN